MYIRSCFNMQVFFHIMVYILIFFNLSDFRNSEFGPAAEGGGGGSEGAPR